MATSIPLPSSDLKKHDPVILPEGIWYNVDSCAAEMRKSQEMVDEHVKAMVAMISSSFTGKKNVIGKIRMKGEGEGACLECPKALESHILVDLAGFRLNAQGVAFCTETTCLWSSL
eukprot:jgi/Picre1/30289/NNA_005653.t1